MAKFTKIPADTFKQLQINAGVILSDFTPATGAFEPENQLGATTGGITFAATPTFSDYGEDVDNCPKNIQYSYQSRRIVGTSARNVAVCP